VGAAVSSYSGGTGMNWNMCPSAGLVVAFAVTVAFVKQTESTTSSLGATRIASWDLEGKMTYKLAKLSRNL